MTGEDELSELSHQLGKVFRSDGGDLIPNLVQTESLSDPVALVTAILQKLKQLVDGLLDDGGGISKVVLQVDDHFLHDRFSLLEELVSAGNDLGELTGQLDEEIGTDRGDLADDGGKVEVADQVLDGADEVAFTGLAQKLTQSGNRLLDNGAGITDVVGEVADELGDDGLSLGEDLLSSEEELSQLTDQLPQKVATDALDLSPYAAQAEGLEQEIGKSTFAVSLAQDLSQAGDGLLNNSAGITNMVSQVADELSKDRFSLVKDLLTSKEKVLADG